MPVSCNGILNEKVESVCLINKKNWPIKQWWSYIVLPESWRFRITLNCAKRNWFLRLPKVQPWKNGKDSSGPAEFWIFCQKDSVFYVNAFSVAWKTFKYFIKFKSFICSFCFHLCVPFLYLVSLVKGLKIQLNKTSIYIISHILSSVNL